MSKKFVVTGGAGFIGSNLVKELVMRGAEVQVIDNFAAGRLEGRVVGGAVYHEVDIRDLEKLDDVFSHADAVFHMAASTRVQDSINNPTDTSLTNVEGTLQVLEAARRAGARRVVFSSSAAVYGDSEELPLTEKIEPAPKHPYGLHKLMGEQMCALWSSLYKLPTVSLRYFNVYGEGMDPKGAYALVVGKFLDARKKGEPLTISGEGTQTRDFVHVRDIVKANLLAAESQKVGKGEVMNVGSGVETSIKELAEQIGGPVQYMAPRIEIGRSVADVSLANSLLNWQPSLTVAEGIKQLKALHGLE